MTSKQTADFACMATLPYDNPFDDDIENEIIAPHKPSAKIIKVEYNIRTAFIQGFDEEHKNKLPNYENKKFLHRERNLRPVTSGILKRKSSNIPPPHSIIKPQKNSIEHKKALPKQLRLKSNLYENLSNELKRREESIFAFQSFIAKLAETQVNLKPLLNTINRNKIRPYENQKKILIERRKILIPKSQRWENRPKSNAQRKRRISSILVNRSLDQELVVKNSLKCEHINNITVNSTKNCDNSMFNLQIFKTENSLTACTSVRNSQKHLFTNNLIKEKLDDQNIQKIGEEELEESPIKDKLCSKY